MCHGEGRAGSSAYRLGYCAYLTQQLWQAQDLSRENPQADEDAGHEAQETPQVLGGNFTQIEGHHTETDTWGYRRDTDGRGSREKGVRPDPWYTFSHAMHHLQWSFHGQGGHPVCPMEIPTTEPVAVGNMKSSPVPWEWAVGTKP